jgi:hypothetical protein
MEQILYVCVCVCVDKMWNSAKNSKPAFLLHRLLSVRNLVLLMLCGYVMQVYKPAAAYSLPNGLVCLTSAEMVRP